MKTCPKINQLVSALLILLLQFNMGYPQIDPVVYKSVWSKAGYPGEIPHITDNIIDVTGVGAVADGITDNYNAIQSAIDNASAPAVIFFPAGTYYIQGQLILKSGVVLRGEGSTVTHLHFYSGDGCIKISGANAGSYVDIESGHTKGSTTITVSDASGFTIGEGARIRQGNVHEPTLTGWVEPYSPGQMVKITAINDNTLTIGPALNFDYASNPPLTTDHGPEMIPIRYIEDVGIEDFHIKRIHSDDGWGSNINISRAANCWIKGIESEYTLKYHISASQCLNLEIRHNYIHTARSRGDGGQGYGVSLAYNATSVLVEDNIFYYLRHAMIIQLGVNGCVFGYNYAERNFSDDGWDKTAISLHGHYVHMNLYEGNVVGWIGIGDYWGPDGPDNTFFRNRALGTDRHEEFGDNRGIMYADFDGPQYIIGNEVTGGNIYFVQSENSESDSSLVVIHGNNVKGDIDWEQGLSPYLPESYYLNAKPSYFDTIDWPPLGNDKVLGKGIIPALARWQSENFTSNYKITINNNNSMNYSIYPNPSHGELFLNASNIDYDMHIILYDELGQLLWEKTYPSYQGSVADVFNISCYPPGIYLLMLSMNNEVEVKKIVVMGH